MNAVTPNDLKDQLRQKLAAAAGPQAERLLVEIEDAEAAAAPPDAAAVADAAADAAAAAAAAADTAAAVAAVADPPPAATAARPHAASRPTARTQSARRGAAAAMGLSSVPAQLAGVEVTLSVEVGAHQLTLQDLVNVEPGQLFALDRMTDEPVTILVNGQPFAEGEVVALDDRFGVRLLAILPAGDD